MNKILCCNRNLLYVYDEKSPREYYEIEITGLKDVYLVGEQYDFFIYYLRIWEFMWK